MYRVWNRYKLQKMACIVTISQKYYFYAFKAIFRVTLYYSHFASILINKVSSFFSNLLIAATLNRLIKIFNGFVSLYNINAVITVVIQYKNTMVIYE